MLNTLPPSIISGYRPESNRRQKEFPRSHLKASARIRFHLRASANGCEVTLRALPASHFGNGGSVTGRNKREQKKIRHGFDTGRTVVIISTVGFSYTFGFRGQCPRLARNSSRAVISTCVSVGMGLVSSM